MRRFLLLSAVLVGCVAPEPADDPQAPAGEIDQGVCAAVWGEIPDGGRLFVDAAASPGGDGTIAAPFDTIGDGITAARATGIRSVAIAGGEYEHRLRLNDAVAGWNDAGLEVTGCGQGVTIISAVVEIEKDAEGGWDEFVQPVVDITGVGTDGIVVRDFTAIGGRRAVIVRGGAGATEPVVIQRITLEESIRGGVLVDGLETVANLTEVHVDGVVAEDGLGHGIAIQTGAWFADSIPGPTTVSMSVVEGAIGVGILAEGGWNTLTDVTVADTQALDGELGRGIQLQSRTRADLLNVTSTGNSDAALFVHLAGRDGEGINIVDSILGDTAGSDVADTGETAGEGLSITNGGDPATPTELVTLTGTALSGNVRADVLVDGGALEIGAGNSFGAEGQFGVVVQSNGVAQGPGGTPPDVGVTELSDADSLGLISDAIQLDGLEE